MESLVNYGPALLFYVFACMAVGAALLVITLRNPVYSAISLLVTFLSVAALFLLRHAEFVAIVQIFVYGGGVMVLFLFVIMLVNLHKLHEVRLFGVQWPMAALIGALFVLVIGTVVIAATSFGPTNPLPENLTSVEGESWGNTQAVAWLLFREYFVPFEIASLFLLVAMIGAVVLARKE
jgi:NADH-quinone oxidoreductase subunit J